jgi:23S rRNA (guanosine2251-2'-O)-methyltransferase
MNEPHPRDRFITVFGRKPVLEALSDDALTIDKVLLARKARGPTVDALLRVAEARGVQVRRVEGAQVTRLSRNKSQDQGVVADVQATRMGALASALPRLPARAGVLLLDGLTTPGNVGMVLRTATAAGLDGIVLPRRGCPEVSPMVIKASAGVAFRAPILRCASASEGARALVGAGFTLIGLRGAPAEPLFTAALPARAAFVVGNETSGLSDAVAQHVTRWMGIPMASGVESLNAAVASALVAYEWTRRGAT